MDGNDSKEGLARHLSQFISGNKKRLMEAVLDHRTRHLALVLEDIYQSQNASAVFRTMECFGIQDVHLIENQHAYGANKRVLQGADKWLTINHYNKPGADNTPLCFARLKDAGYRILATSPAADTPIGEVDISQKIAVVMGNELHGLSETACKGADQLVKIPMEGFTESLNLSVSAAICIYELMGRVRASSINWQLPPSERADLKLEWYRKSVKRSEMIEQKYLRSIQ